MAGTTGSSGVPAQTGVTLSTRSLSLSPQVSPGGTPPSQWMGTVCRNASLASLSCHAEDKLLLSQWPFGRQLIYLGCCSLIVRGNVYPKYLIAALHKLRIPGEEAQAAAGAGTNVSAPGTAEVKDTFSLLPKNHILSASKSDIF